MLYCKAISQQASRYKLNHAPWSTIPQEETMASELLHHCLNRI
uniref:Uncharacterized protein n=1 Tax=Anguilla anguilla TaxID=7936 RepID=A0A0E9VF70_ANGAN